MAYGPCMCGGCARCLEDQGVDLRAEVEEIEEEADAVFDDAADFASLVRALGLPADAPDPHEERRRFVEREAHARGLGG